MKFTITLSLVIFAVLKVFAQDSLQKLPKDEEFCKIIYRFVAESRIGYRNIIQEPITVEGNWFYGSSRIALPGARKTVIKQNLYYHAYCEMFYTDTLAEAEKQFTELVQRLRPCLPPQWRTSEDIVPNSAYMKQFATSQSNSSPSVYVEIVPNKPGEGSLYTVQVRFLALN